MTVADREEFALTPIEQLYQQALDKMTGTERVTKTVALYEAGWRMVACQVQKEYEQYGPLPERELRYRVALRMYESDPVTIKMLHKLYKSYEHSDAPF